MGAGGPGCVRPAARRSLKVRQHHRLFARQLGPGCGMPRCRPLSVPGNAAAVCARQKGQQGTAPGRAPRGGRRDPPRNRRALWQPVQSVEVGGMVRVESARRRVETARGCGGVRVFHVKHQRGGASAGGLSHPSRSMRPRGSCRKAAGQGQILITARLGPWPPRCPRGRSDGEGRTSVRGARSAAPASTDSEGGVADHPRPACLATPRWPQPHSRPRASGVEPLSAAMRGAARPSVTSSAAARQFSAVSHGEPPWRVSTPCGWMG